MGSKFFTPFLKNYNEQIKSVLKKDNIEIKTSAEIMDLMTEPKSIAHNLTRKSLAKTATASERTQIIREARRAINIQVQMEKCIHTFLNTCTKIGQNYIKTAISNALDHNNYKYDIAIIWDPTFRAYKPPANKRHHFPKGMSQDEIFYQGYAEHNRKLASGILGVIIVQRGECGEYGAELNRTMSVRLICANNSTTAKNLARILMGLLIFSVKMFRMRASGLVNKNVILELSGSYLNMIGFCSYSKFGFRHAPDSDIGTCYYGSNVLPMYCDTEKLTFDQLFAIINGSDSGAALAKPILCQERFRILPEKIQHLIILLVSVRDFLEVSIYEQQERAKTGQYLLNPRTEYGLNDLQFRVLRKLMSRYSKFPNSDGISKETADKMILIKRQIYYPDKPTFLHDVSAEDLVFFCSIIDNYIEYIADHPRVDHLGLKLNKTMSQRSATLNRSSLKSRSRSNVLPFRETRSL
jgi:hypothetical protein